MCRLSLTCLSPASRLSVVCRSSVCHLSVVYHSSATCLPLICLSSVCRLSLVCPVSVCRLSVCFLTVVSPSIPDLGTDADRTNPQDAVHKMQKNEEDPKGALQRPRRLKKGRQGHPNWPQTASNKASQQAPKYSQYAPGAPKGSQCMSCA